jgi:hypothetical protein
MQAALADASVPPRSRAFLDQKLSDLADFLRNQ